LPNANPAGLLDLGALVLKCLVLNQIGDLIIVIVFLAFGPLVHGLVALGQLTERGQGIRAQLVEDAGHKFGQLLVFSIAVDGKKVARDGGVNWNQVRRASRE